MKCYLDYQQDTSQIRISRFEICASLSLGRKYLKYHLRLSRCKCVTSLPLHFRLQARISHGRLCFLSMTSWHTP